MSGGQREGRTLEDELQFSHRSLFDEVFQGLSLLLAQVGRHGSR